MPRPRAANRRIPSAEHEVGRTGGNWIGDSRKFLRIERAVAIHKTHDVGCRRQEARVASCAEPALRFVYQYRPTACCHRPGIVGRGIVDNDRPVTIWNPREYARQCRGFIQHGEDDIGHWCTLRVNFECVHQDVSGGRRSRRYILFAAAALLGWAVLWWTTKLWGEHLLMRYPMNLPAPPLAGFWHRRLNQAVFPTAAAGLLIAFGLPVIAERARWWIALAAGVFTTIGFASILTLNDGWRGFQGGVDDPSGFLAALPKVHSVGQFLHDFIRLIREVRVGIHVQGHPPGMVIVAWAFNQLGQHGGRRFAMLVIVAGALGGGGVLIVVRRLVDETTARRALPFVAVAPACVWIASTADAFFAGVAAWTIVCLAYAITTTGRRSIVLSVGCGLAYFCCLMLSYGLALFAIPIVVMCVWRRRWVPCVTVFATAGVGLLLVRTQGFWWVDGLRTTKMIYFQGVARHRPQSYFLFANIAALGIALGPMIPVAYSQLRDRRVWILIGSVVVAVIAADVSGMSRAEVERIWLPFTTFLLAGGSALWLGPRPRRAAQLALVVQVGFTVWLQTNMQLFW